MSELTAADVFACPASGGDHVVAPDVTIPGEVEADPTLATKDYDGTCMACGDGGFPIIEQPHACHACGVLHARYRCPGCGE